MRFSQSMCLIKDSWWLSYLILIVMLFSLSLPSQAAIASTAKIKDCTKIQNSLAQLGSNGGEIFIPAGIYSCTKPIILDKNNILLRGAGARTLLRLADNTNAPVIIMGSAENIPSHSTHHVEVRDLIIDGNRLNQNSECMGGPCSAEFPLRNNGISIRRCVDCQVQSVTVYGAISGGLVTELGCRRLYVNQYTSYDNEFDGLAGYETEDSSFNAITLFANKGAGISTDIQFNNNKFNDVTILDNKTVGIFMRDSLDNTFINLHIRNSSQHGIFLAQVDADTSKPATGNTFTSVVIAGSGGYGFLANDNSCINNMMLAVQFVDNKAGCIGEAASGLVERAGAICR